MAAEEVAEGVEFADASFGGGGQVGVDERELGEPFECMCVRYRATAVS